MSLDFKSPAFDQAIDWLLSPDIEGAHSNDPADRGGDTWYGISRNAHPDISWPPTLLQAKTIYHEQYWRACRCPDLPPVLAVATFDAAVQHGARQAVRLLQQALGIQADGIIGPVTLKAAHAFCVDASLGTNQIDHLLSYRARYYSAIVANDDTQSRFIRGWMRRLFSLQQLLWVIAHSDQQGKE